MIGLITDTFDLISKQGWCQSHSRVLPTSFSNLHCAPEHGPSASVNGQCWQPSAQGRVSLFPLLHQRPSNALIPILPYLLNPLHFHMLRWSHLIVLHHILLSYGLLKHALKGLAMYLLFSSSSLCACMIKAYFCALSAPVFALSPFSHPLRSLVQQPLASSYPL